MPGAAAPNPYDDRQIPAEFMPKGDRPIVLYPAYFDLGRSRAEGRRVAKRWAVESPTMQEVATAAKALGLEPQVEEGKAFPSTPWRKEGRVLVRADYFKTSILHKVAKHIKESR
jgi:signal recognition particle subunit SRP19